MNEKPYKELTVAELIEKMRGYTADDMRYKELRAELDRRQVVEQISASSAQVRASWCQFSAMVAMVVVAAATAYFQWLAWAHHH